MNDVRRDEADALVSLSQLLVSIFFIGFGVVASFCCAIVDGIFAARHIVSNAEAPCLNNQINT